MSAAYGFVSCRPGRVVLFVLIAVLITTGLALAGLYRHKWLQYEEVLNDLEPRVARFQGLLDAREDIERMLAVALESSSHLAYPADVDASHALADLQSRVRDALVRAGVEVVGTQAVNPRARGSIEELGLTVAARADLAQLQQGLLALATSEPRVRIEYLQLVPFSVSRGATDEREPQLLNIQMRLASSRFQES